MLELRASGSEGFQRSVPGAARPRLCPAVLQGSAPPSERPNNSFHSSWATVSSNSLFLNVEGPSQPPPSSFSASDLTSTWPKS